jgi:hypothetical protein
MTSSKENPLPQRFSGVKLLSRAEVQALLAVLRRDASPIGLRDFAFILARLRLGVPLGHLQKLRWGQVEVTEAGAHLRWRGGGDPVRLPDEVWVALQRCLSASGRLASLQPEAFVFAPLDRPDRQEVGERASDWREGTPLTPRQLWHILKRYGALAHIPPEKLTLEGLRLTALRLKLDEGCRLAEIKAFMDSRSPLKALKYRLKDLPELPPDVQATPEPPASLPVEVLYHTQHLYQPGDGFKHGFYARSQPPEMVKAILAEHIHGIEEELEGLHLLGQGLLERQARASSASEMVRLGDAYTLTAARLGEMLRAERERTGGKPGSRERASQVESIVDWLVRAEASQGKPTSREAVLADLQAQALGGGAELGLTAQRLEEEIAGPRGSLRNILTLALQAGSSAEYIYLVDLYSKGCSRLVRMLHEGQVGDERLYNYLQDSIRRAIAELSKDWI